jgi:Zn-dependent protease with chaperone function
MPKIFMVIVGLGLMCLGISVIYFLIKFIFVRSKDENASRVEITENQQPRLFAFIRQLSKETHTPFPKKIFISPDFNACVFYNSGFRSMFLPVRKNLEIGLGLVNSINASELKAVIAHEFGHFSQRSMKLGSPPAM